MGESTCSSELTGGHLCHWPGRGPGLWGPSELSGLRVSQSPEPWLLPHLGPAPFSRAQVPSLASCRGLAFCYDCCSEPEVSCGSLGPHDGGAVSVPSPSVKQEHRARSPDSKNSQRATQHSHGAQAPERHPPTSLCPRNQGHSHLGAWLICPEAPATGYFLAPSLCFLFAWTGPLVLGPWGLPPWGSLQLG